MRSFKPLWVDLASRCLRMSALGGKAGIPDPLVNVR